MYKWYGKLLVCLIIGDWLNVLLCGEFGIVVKFGVKEKKFNDVGMFLIWYMEKELKSNEIVEVKGIF